jgi:hypothetical protein
LLDAKIGPESGSEFSTTHFYDAAVLDHFTRHV